MVCQKCNNGLLPLIKNGKVIANAFIDCDCKQPNIEIERIHQYSTEDFDFPMSPDWWDFYKEKTCKIHQSPLPSMPETTTKIVEHYVTEERIIDPKLSKLEGNLTSLRNTLKEHVLESPKKKFPKYTISTGEEGR